VPTEAKSRGAERLLYFPRRWMYTLHLGLAEEHAQKARELGKPLPALEILLAASRAEVGGRGVLDG
jgi:hypothetical protein